MILFQPKAWALPEDPSTRGPFYPRTLLPEGPSTRGSFTASVAAGFYRVLRVARVSPNPRRLRTADPS